MVISDGTPLTSEIITHLINKGWSKIALLTYPNSIVPSTVENLNAVLVVKMKDLSELSIQDALQTIIQKFGHIDSVLALVPQFQSLKLQLFENKPTEEVLKHLFFLAKYLHPELTKNRFSGNERHSFMIVTHMDGQLGIAGNQWYEAIQGGYYGLLKTINVEWQAVFNRIIDFAPQLPIQKQADAVLKELFDPNLSLVEVGHSESGRNTIGTIVQNHPILNPKSNLDVKPADVFIVPGGGKGVTASCVIEIARKFKNKFILIGRSEVHQTEPEWAINISDTNTLKKNLIMILRSKGEKPIPKQIDKAVDNILSSREILSSIQQIEAAGSEVKYYIGDVTNREQMQKIVNEGQNQFGQITSVLHGAGVLADKHIHKKTESDYNRVYQTKINGLRVLLSVVPIESIKHLILFSSAAGFYGNEAQSDYALANEILNKTGYLVKQLNPGCHIISANWGPWDMGMVTPQLKKLFNARGIKVIPEKAGTEILCNELSNPNKNLNQIVVGSSMVVPVQPEAIKNPISIIRTIDLKNNPTILDHVIGGEAVLPVVFAMSWIAETCQKQYPGFWLSQCHEMCVLKGIILKTDVPVHYQIEITQQPETSQETIHLTVSVSSPGSGKLPVLHYKCNIILKKVIESAPIHFLTTAIVDSAIDNPAFYEDGTLFHGSSLQGIQQVLSIDDFNMVLSCASVSVSEKQLGQFSVDALNHYAADVMLQAVVVWARKQHGFASLPLKIGSGTFYRILPFDEKYIIEVEITNSNAAKVVSNIKCVDQKGQVYMELSDVEITLSKNLNQKFLENQLL